MNNKLTDLNITDAKKKLKFKEISVKELVEAHIQKVKEIKHLNAYILETFEHALKQASDSQKRYNSDEDLILDGIPIAIKDLFCTKNFRTTAASNMLRNYIPPYESTVTHKIFESGAVMLGKANMDDNAMGSSNKTSCFGECINPWKSN